MAIEYNGTPQPTQGIGHPTRDDTHRHWRYSILVGPQTAGLPTIHNEDEWARDEDVMGSNQDMVPPVPDGRPKDFTGGALVYHNSQRRR